MTPSFAGRLGVITGAASGIGRETAALLAEEGMRLALLDIDAEGLDETKARLGDANIADSYHVDVSDHQTVTSTAERVIQGSGAPAVLVNSVGYLGPVSTLAWELTDEDWHTVLGVNLFGVVNVVRAFLPAMHAAARPARVVNLASMAGLWPETRAGAYAAAKHAVVAYTETLAEQLRAVNATVHASVVCPGAVPTNLNKALRETTDHVPQTGWLDASTVARLIVDVLREPRRYVFTHAGSRQRLADYHSQVLAAYGALPAPGSTP